MSKYTHRRGPKRAGTDRRYLVNTTEDVKTTVVLLNITQKQKAWLDAQCADGSNTRSLLMRLAIDQYMEGHS